MSYSSTTIPIVLNCEGLGDCLFAIPIIKKLRHLSDDSCFVIFTHHTSLFDNCPYIHKAYSLDNTSEMKKHERGIVLFDVSLIKKHWLMDTFDFISIPLGIGGLSFREKQLEYFPVEKDNSENFDVVINTSATWPSRSWSMENWQKVADFALERNLSVAVVGKDVFSKADNMMKKAAGLKGCKDLTNKLSLDQTYYTIKNSNLFISCQNGLSVLSGATDTEIIVLDMSIEWSKRAIYRNEDPHYKISYVKGKCNIYCCEAMNCSRYGQFKCIPDVDQVLEVLSKKLLFA